MVMRYFSSAAARAIGVAWTLTLTLAVAACGGPVSGILTPLGHGADGGSTVELMVATTRADAEVTADMFSGERGDALSFADFKISIPPESARAVGEVQRPRAVPGDPARDFVVVEGQKLGLSEALTVFDERVAKVPGRRVLVFVHGYNTRFDDAVLRLAQIVHDSGATVEPVLFTWPSRAQLLAYGYDRESANFSRTALETVLRALANDPAVSDVSVLAHSMGNWVAMEALRQMAIRDGRIAPKITNVMLASPDVDIDVFRKQMIDIGPERPTVTLFVSGDDRALAVSKRVWGGRRLGSVDPEQEPYRSAILRSGINVLDLTGLRAGDPLNHGKFASSPEVVRMIGTRLMAGQTLTDSRASVGERIIQVTNGVATTAGTAVGLAVSAPVAVIDAETRRNFGSEVQNLGDSLTEPLGSGVPRDPGTGAGAAAEARR